jgi:quercetin dioxygenase-like cupin family protein
MKNTKTSLILSSCLLFSLFGASLKAQVKDEPKTEKKYTIDNCVTEFSMDKTVKTQVGYQFWFADPNFIDGRTLKMSVVAPHSATHPPHRHAEDEFFFVLEGTAEFYLDGKTKTAGPYTSFYCPSNVEHGIKNVGDTELKYLVIKKYEKK